MHFWVQQVNELKSSTAVNSLEQKLIYKTPKEIINIQSKIIENITSNNKILQSLQYEVFQNVTDENLINEITDFINANYLVEETSSVIYDKELIRWYLHDALVIMFKKNNILISLCTSKLTHLFYHDKVSKKFGSYEASFNCIKKGLRNIDFGKLQMSTVIKESCKYYDELAELSHATTSVKLSVPYFNITKYYHIPINIQYLFSTGFLNHLDDDISYNIYKYNKELTIKYIDPQKVENNKQELYEQYIDYCDKNYNLYNKITYQEFLELLKSKAFYNFEFYKGNDLKGYLCLIKNNIQINKMLVKNALIYLFMFNYSKYQIMECLLSYIYINQIFDTITIQSAFDCNWKKLKCVEGTGKLYHYLYNGNIQNIKSNIVTI